MEKSSLVWNLKEMPAIHHKIYVLFLIFKWVHQALIKYMYLSAEYFFSYSDLSSFRHK